MSSKAVTKRGLKDLPAEALAEKRVFVRVDLNVPLNERSEISDDTRIRAVVPTVRYLIERKAKVILASHLVNFGAEQECSKLHAIDSTVPHGCSVEPALPVHLPFENYGLHLDLSPQGRPKGPEEKSSLKHVVANLSKAIGTQVSLTQP